MDKLVDFMKRLDDKSDLHTNGLSSLHERIRALDPIAKNTERIADSLENITNRAFRVLEKKHQTDWKVAALITLCAGVITGVVVLTLTGTSLKAAHNGTSVEVGK